MKQRVKVAKAEVTLQDNGDKACEEITLAEQVYRQLRRDIISGQITAGQPLRLEYLKARYGITPGETLEAAQLREIATSAIGAAESSLLRSWIERADRG